MDFKEVNQLFIEGEPIYYEGKKYKRIEAIVWRIIRDDNGKPIKRQTQAEILDENNNSVMVVEIGQLKKTL